MLCTVRYECNTLGDTCNVHVNLLAVSSRGAALGIVHEFGDTYDQESPKYRMSHAHEKLGATIAVLALPLPPSSPSLPNESGFGLGNESVAGVCLCRQHELYPNQTSGNDRQCVRLESYLDFIDITGRGSKSSL